MTPSRLVAAAILSAVAGCSNDKIAGNSSETENTLARRLSVDSILSSWNRPSGVPTVATLRFDSTNFDFSKFDSAGDEFTVQRLDSTPIPFEMIFWDKAAARGRVRVRLDTDLLATGSSFDVLRRTDARNRSNPAAVWAAIPDSQKLSINSVLVDDFEHGSMLNLLPVPQAWYFSLTDSAAISWFTLGVAGAERSGNAIGIGYSANAIRGRYVLIGSLLGMQPKFFSFRTLDSLVFWARGRGTLSPSLDHYVATRGTKAKAHFALDTAWRRFRIRPIDFDSADGIGGNIGWEKIRDSVNNLSFIVSDTSDTSNELWIDDVRFYGLNRDDLW